MRSKEKEAVWRERLAELERSGMSLKAYAEKIGVNANTLSGWRWKLRRRAKDDLGAAKDAIDGHDFTDVTSQLAAALTGDAGIIEIELGHALVRVRGHVGRDALASVLGALGGRG